MASRISVSLSLATCAAFGGALAGCGAEESPRPDPATQRPAARSAAPEARAERPAVPALPPVGEFRIERRGDRVSIAAHRAPLEEVLSKLSSELGFSTQIYAPIADRTATLQRPISSLHSALDALLEGLPYSIESEWDPESGLRVERRLVVGAIPDAAARQLAGIAARAASRFTGGSAPVRRFEEEPGEFEDDFDLDSEEVDAIAERPLEELLRDLDSREAIVRARAASAIEPEGRGLDALLQVIDRDPDPRVRVAATERLEDATTFGGVQGLLRALEDRDSRVVVAALEALEFAGDESNVPDIERYSDHPDKAVRRAAREAIDFLRD